MPLPTRTLTDDEQEHLDDHNNIIKPVIDAYEGTDPSDYAAAAHVHAATAITFAAGGTFASTNADAAIREAAADATSALNAHLTDTADAHDASAISLTATGEVVENNVQDAVENLDQRITSISVAAAGTTSGIGFSGLSGANDDARLVNYNTLRTSASSGLFGWPLILDGNRTYDFNAPITISSGFKIIDPSGAHGSDQNRSQHPVGNVVDIAGVTGGWLNLPNGQNYGIGLVGLSINGDSSSRVFGLNAAGQMTMCHFHNNSMQNALSFFGSSSVKQLMTICTMSGNMCNVNNLQDTGMNIGGSDCAFDFGRINYDTTPALLADTQYMIRFDALSKTYVKGMYITAEEHSAMLLTSGNGDLNFDHCIFEGRNNTQPCFGALVRDSTAFSSYTNCSFNYAMTAPASGPNAGDLGYIHHTDGTHVYQNCHTRYANGQNAGTVSVIYATGATTVVRVNNFIGEGQTGVTGTTNNEVFTPRVRCVGSSTGVVDTSVTLITI